MHLDRRRIERRLIDVGQKVFVPGSMFIVNFAALWGNGMRTQTQIWVCTENNIDYQNITQFVIMLINKQMTHWKT